MGFSGYTPHFIGTSSILPTQQDMQLTCEPTSTYISNTSSTIANQQDVRLTHEPPSTYTASIRSIQQNAVNN